MLDKFIEGVRVIELGDESIRYQSHYQYITPYSVVITNYEIGDYSGSGLSFNPTYGQPLPTTPVTK